MGQPQNAIVQVQRVLAMLDGTAELAAGRDDLVFPRGFDLMRVAWESAGWHNAGDPKAEGRAKADLVRWRLHCLLGELTGDPGCYYAASLLRPDLSAVRGELGAALAQQGRFTEAVPHLEEALRQNPFTKVVALELHAALGRLGLTPRPQELARARRRLGGAAPGLVPAEPWFAEPPLPPD